ncbi:uncharacterized protein [Periplaneta americana]|uniref:uncharacterized protein n=1 Tax=Periplaneta americana TaxID=6978 RepID=UPI0037E7A51D
MPPQLDNIVHFHLFWSCDTVADQCGVRSVCGNNAARLDVRWMSPKNKDVKGKKAKRATGVVDAQQRTRAGRKHVEDEKKASAGDDDVTTECGGVAETDLERALFRWFERYQQQQQRERHAGGDEVRVTVLLSTAELRKKAHGIARRMGASQDLLDRVTRSWVRRWQSRYGVPKASTTPPPPAQSTANDVTITVTSTSTAAVAVEVPSPAEQLRRILRGGDYAADQVYCAYGFQLDWKSLPDRTLEESNASEKVWVLMAGNRTGRHRTRMLITGRLWRPPSLRHVNMLSQPVVYAGGGSGTLTPDLFTWWFHREFAPAAAALHPRGAVLVVRQAPFVPQESECVSADGAVRLVVFPEGEFGDGAVLDHGLVVSELRTRYAMLLLSSVAANSTDHQHATLVPDYLKTFSLKDAFPMLHRSWLNVRSETFLRCWERVASLTNEEPVAYPRAPACTLALSSSGATPTQAQEDRMMLLELQWLSHDLGLEVTDDDLATWARLESSDPTAPPPDRVKTEPAEEGSAEGAVSAVPSAAEAADHLAQALLWMESEPLDPGLLLVVRDIITLAKQASKMGLAPTHPGAALPFFCHNGDHLTQPPPAHMGIPPYQLDPKGAGAMGLTRPPMYPFSAGQYPYPMLSPEMSQVAATWHTPSMYPISTAGAGFRSPYPSSLPITSTSLSSDFYRFSPTGLIPPHPGLSPHSHPHSHPHSLASHPAIVTPGPKQELATHQVDHNHKPLNLVKKKNKPVAVVAPSSVIEKNNPEKEISKSDSIETVIKNCHNVSKGNCVYDDVPELDSSNQCKNADFDRPGGMLEALLTRKDPTRFQRVNDTAINNYGKDEKTEEHDVNSDKVVGGDKMGCDFNKMTSGVDDPGGGITNPIGGVDPLRPDGLYSMIHSLAACEHKFLTALYMNSLVTAAAVAPAGAMPPPVLGFGFPPGHNYFLGYENPNLAEACRSNLVASNAPIMNNLLSFADTQHRLWQMVNWQQENNQQRLSNNVCSSSATDISNTAVSSTAESERGDDATPEQTVSDIIIPIPKMVTSLPPSDGKKSKPNAKRSTSMDQKNTTSSTTEGSKTQDSGQTSNNQDKKKPHIKKPLNAFMLYMKEMRAKVVAECTLKESAAINQILGRRWHALGREEQAKYYELARRERQLHMQLYPDWSSRANSSRGKKRKRKQETNDGGNSMKKCRARYGLDQQSQWCKPCSPDGPSHGNPPGHPPGHPPGPGPNPTGLGVHASIIHHGNTTTSNAASPQEPTYVNLYSDRPYQFELLCWVRDINAVRLLMCCCIAVHYLFVSRASCKRKKKCIRYMESNESMDGNQSEDNLGSCGSVGDANTPPEDDRESINHSLSSPGGLSGLSSLTSPSMILPSPSTSLASPSVSLASPCMSLQSPLTPHDASAFECKTPMNGLGGSILPPHQPPSTSSNTGSGGGGGGGGLPSVHHHHPPHHPPPAGPPLHRNPVGTNPHDINNPLSVNQLTGQCIKTESGGSGKDSSSNSARAVISVT